MFDVSLRGIWERKWIDTDNEYTDLPPKKDTKYLILGLRYKNTDIESRMVGVPDLIINYNNRDYNFDRPETVLAKGFSTGMESVNPLSTAVIIFVYKLPKELKGTAYYHPGRGNERKFIRLEIK